MQDLESQLQDLELRHDLELEQDLASEHELESEHDLERDLESEQLEEESLLQLYLGSLDPVMLIVLSHSVSCIW